MIVQCVVKLLQLVGSFPVVFKRRHLGENKFSVSKALLCVSLLQIAFVSVTAYITFASCSNFDNLRSLKNKSALWVNCGLTLLDISFVVFSLFLTVFRLVKTKSCLETGLTIFENLSHKFDAAWPYCLIFSNLLFHCGKVVFILLFFFDNPKAKEVSFVLLKYCSELVPLAVNCCIMILLLVTELSFEDVNRTIEEMTEDSTKISVEEMKNISKIHWDTGDFFVLLNSTFGLDIFLFVSHCFLKLVLIVYDVLTTKTGLNINYALTLFDIAKLIFDVLIFTTRADGAVTQRTRTAPLLHFLRRNKSAALTEEMNSEIEFFLRRVACRNIKMTPCNFFNFDRGLLYKLIMLIINYSIILSQLKSID